MKNKGSFVALLNIYLQAAGCNHYQAVGDTLIVSEVIKIVELGPSVLVGEDTDQLVLLITRATKKVFLLMPGKKGKMDCTYSIKHIHNHLGDMKDYMLLLQALTGSDSTSAPFRKGKKNAYKCSLQIKNFIIRWTSLTFLLFF